MKLSLIIPVYNVENYIQKCINSCLNQNIPLSDYEIIIVNDGSKDNSLQIAEELANCHSNIKIISQQNQGLSASRNNGLKIAKGDYVWFIDSDDWIEPNILKSLLSYTYKNQLDVLCFNLQLVYENGIIEPYIINYKNEKQIFTDNSFVTHVKMPPASVLALYKRSFLKDNNLFFMEGILHEDNEFTPKVYTLAKRISFLNIVAYNYLQRSGSIMKSDQSKRRAVDFLKIADSLYSFNNSKLVYNKNAFNYIQEQIAFIFSQSLAFYQNDYFSLDEYKKKPYYPLVINKTLPLKKKIKYIFINFSLKSYLFLHKHL